MSEETRAMLGEIDDLRRDIGELQSENKALKKAIEDFGNNPAGFDWGVLNRLNELEDVNQRHKEALEKIFEMCDCVTSDIEKRVRNVAKQALKGEK